jgi:predicted RNase H-like HicB family nuclease
MIYKNLHLLSQNAVNDMLSMAQLADGDLTDFHERQLVHNLFMKINSSHKSLWAAFEYGYFKGEKWLKGKADICACVNNYYAWFEVKSTGLNPERWDNSHIGIWEDDINKFTATIEKDGKWFVAYCPEIPGANGQGRTKSECLKSLGEAINLILEDRREDTLRDVPQKATCQMVTVG